MARHYIPGARTRQGERLFTSDSDGDGGSRRPQKAQKVYREHTGAFGGASRVKSTYDPDKGKFKK